MLKFRIFILILISLIISSNGFAKGQYTGRPNVDFGVGDWNGEMIQKIKSVKNPYCFAVMGDNRDGDAIFRKILDKTNADSDIKFSIDIGDIVSHGQASEYKNLINIIKPFKTPLIMALGNHDIPGFGMQYFEQIFGPPYFRFDVGNAAFFVMNVATSDGRFFDDKQAAWLISELKKAQNMKYRFVFFHVPLFEPRIFSFDPINDPKKVTKAKMENSYGLKDRDMAFRILNIFMEQNVSMIFVAHNHSYYQGKWGGIPFQLTGGAGAPLKGRDKAHEFYHYLKVCMNPEGPVVFVIKID